MKVAVPREKHSPRFGQRASSQTVTSRSSRRSTRRGRAEEASGLLLRAHGGRRNGGDVVTPSVLRLHYEGLELLLVAEADLDLLRVRAPGEVAHAHVEEALALRGHHVGGEAL